MLNKANVLICSFFLLFATLFSPLLINAEEETLPINNYINDYADLLDTQTEADLNAQGEAFASQTGAQVVIVTTDSLHGADAMKVATDSANQAKLGSGELDNGVLILVNIDDKQRFMAVGSGLEGDLTDIDCEHLQQDYLVPAFRNGDYQEGLVDLYQHTIDHIANAYGIEPSASQNSAYDNSSRKEEDSFDFGGLGLIVMVLLFTGFFLLRRPSAKNGTVLRLTVHQTYYLNISGVNFSKDTVIVGSSKPSVASITPNGLITAHAVGEAIITVQKLDETKYLYRVIVSHSNSGGRRRSNDDVWDALFLGSMLGRSHRGGSSYRPRSNGNGFGGFGGFGGGGGFTGGGGGFRGGGSGGSW